VRASTGFRTYAVDPSVVAAARRMGMFGNVEHRIARMARHGAPFTHAAGNRRFDSYVLRVEGGRVVGIQKFDPETGEPVGDVLEEIDRRSRALRAIARHLGTVPD
jgi:hypothetical protein